MTSLEFIELIISIILLALTRPSFFRGASRPSGSAFVKINRLSSHGTSLHFAPARWALLVCLRS